MKHIPGLVLLTAIAWIHFRDIPTKLLETPYMGWGYILLVAGCAASGAWLLTDQARAGYALGGLNSARCDCGLRADAQRWLAASDGRHWQLVGAIWGVLADRRSGLFDGDGVDAQTECRKK